DRRSDVWSLGVCLHESLTGRRLFARDSSAQTLLAVCEEEIPRPRAFRTELPDELDAIVMKALERNPDKRFATAEQMRAALDRFLADRTYVPQTIQLGQFLRD